MSRAGYLSGWCNDHHLPPGERALHERCAGAWSTSKGGYRCHCSCHTGDEQPVDIAAATVQAKVQAVTPGKRSKALLEEIAERLRKDGELEFPAPDDEKENKSLRERIYSAARRTGMKVRVTNKDGVIRAVRK